MSYFLKKNHPQSISVPWCSSRHRAEQNLRALQGLSLRACGDLAEGGIVKVHAITDDVGKMNREQMSRCSHNTGTRRHFLKLPT